MMKNYILKKNVNSGIRLSDGTADHLSPPTGNCSLGIKAQI